MPRPQEVLLHLGPKRQTTATTSHGYFPRGPGGKEDSMQGQSPSWEPVRGSLGVWLGREERCHGNCNFQNYLHPLETSSMDLKGFLSHSVLRCQHPRNLFPEGSEKVSVSRCSAECEPSGQTTTGFLCQPSTQYLSELGQDTGQTFGASVSLSVKWSS